MRRIPSVIRYIWAAPTTALGLLVVLAGLWRAQVRVVEGVVEAHGPALAWLLSHFTLMPGGATALTLGHVVIARDSWSLERPAAHERVHVRQCEAWGPLFVPAYVSACLSATLRGGSCYFDNRFEVEAFDAARNEPGAEGAQLGVASQVTLRRDDPSRWMVHQPVETFGLSRAWPLRSVGSSRGPASGSAATRISRAHSSISLVGLLGLARARLCLMIKPTKDEEYSNERGEDAGSDRWALW